MEEVKGARQMISEAYAKLPDAGTYKNHYILVAVSSDAHMNILDVIPADAVVHFYMIEFRKTFKTGKAEWEYYSFG